MEKRSWGRIKETQRSGRDSRKSTGSRVIRLGQPLGNGWNEGAGRVHPQLY